MFNYTDANKANKKRIKKFQKQIDKSEVDKPEFKSNGKYHKGAGFKDGKNNINNKIMITIVNRIRRGNLMVIKFSVITV